MNNFLAALMFFTRLPFHRIKQVPSECFSHVTGWWSITGWLTGGVSALTFFIFYQFVPLELAVILAMLSRVLITGALHEDGLADFIDGFGGGTDREGTLRIMKDSHIGTYGTIGLIFYFLLTFVLIVSTEVQYIPILLLTSDVFCKCVSSHIVFFLPYARPETESKNGTVYSHPTALEETLTLVSGFGVLLLIPTGIGFIGGIVAIPYSLVFTVLPVGVFFLLVLLFKKRIGGYTGDCCGAMFLLTELSFRLTQAFF